MVVCEGNKVTGDTCDWDSECLTGLCDTGTCANGLDKQKGVNYLTLALSMLSTLLIGVSIVFCCRWCLKTPKLHKDRRGSGNERDPGRYKEIRSNLLNEADFSSKESSEEAATSMEMSREQH